MMSPQLEALYDALWSGYWEIKEAILRAAAVAERNFDAYDFSELMGLEYLYSSKNIEIQHYLETTAELGNDGTDDLLWGLVTVVVLREDARYPRVLAEQERINRDGV